MIGASFPAETLQFGGEDEQLRMRIREWLSVNDPGDPPSDYYDRIRALREWQASLCAAGFIGLSWPREFGGSGLSVTSEAVFAEELARSGMPELINRIGVYMVGPTLMDCAERRQMERFLPGMLDASELWCQGFSEPEAGSDLAAVRTSARMAGDEFIVDGQKVWTSRASVSRWCALLVRTDPSVPKHAGLSMLVLDMESSGVTVTPLPQMLNEPHFNEVFLADVRVPAENLIGAPGDGWRVAMQMLTYERGLFVLERQIRLRRRLDELARAVSDSEAEHDSAVVERIGRVYCDLEMLRATVYRTLAAQQSGSLGVGETSIDKLLMSHAYHELYATAVDILGPDVARGMNDWTHDLLDARSTGIYGGTTEIQLGIVARQLMGIVSR